MSANLSISSQPPVIWNEKTILENGMKFLGQKNEELKLFATLWNTSQKGDRFSDSSKFAAKKYQAVAEKSLNEIETLDKTVTHLLNLESAKDSSSEQTNKLLKITLASRCALNYIKSVINFGYYPTYLNQTLETIRSASTIILYSAPLLTALAYSSEIIAGYEIPCISIAGKISILACLAFNTSWFLNKEYRANPSCEKIQNLGHLFEKALSPEKATHSIRINALLQAVDKRLEGK